MMRIDLWPEQQLPGSYDETAGQVEDLIPHLNFQPTEHTGPRPTVMVIPGGGYGFRADAKADLVGEWLNSLGFHAAMLRYRVAPWRYPAPQLDAIRASRLLRHRSAELAIDPDRLMILGGSAGGHLAASVALLHEALPAIMNDAIDQAAACPNLLGLIYPVISATDHCHDGSWRNLLGPEASWRQRAAISLDHWVDPECPPTFLTHCIDDAVVPIANSYRFAAALADAAVPHQLHTHPEGGHGWEFDHPAEEPWYQDFQQQLMTWVTRFWPEVLEAVS